MKKLLLVFMAVAALGLSAKDAKAQLPHSWSASCVSGIGCSQVDFYIELLNGGSAEIDYFWVALTSPGWSFSNPFWGGESEDAFGDPGFFPMSVTGNRIEGDFFFNAFLDPSFRFRAEMETFQQDVSSLSFDCEGSIEGNVVFDCSAGSQPPGSVVPEPATVVLLGSGLVGILGVAYRRRRDDAE